MVLMGLSREMEGRDLSKKKGCIGFVKNNFSKIGEKF